MTARPARRPFALAAATATARIALVSLMAFVASCSSTPSPSSDHGNQAHSASAPVSVASHSSRSFFSFHGNSDGHQCLADWKHAPKLQPDLWDRIHKRYAFKISSKNERVVTERNWYANHQTYLDRMSGRSQRYLYYVAGELEKRDLPSELALLPIVESAYNPFAYSRSQASGLWQFIPSTAKHLKMDMNWWFDERRDIIGSTDNALDYLTFLRDHYDGDWMKAIAAYNAGWGTIDRAVAKNKAKGLPTDYWNLDVPAETKAYVPKLLALAQISKNPGSYGVHWAYIADLPYFAEVNIEGQLDVARAADMAGINSDELYLLNPGVSRWATPPGGPHRLLVPVDEADAFQERVANIKSEDRLQWARYTVKKGDSIGRIAKQFNTSAELIQNVNNKTPGQIAVGIELLMPVADHRMPLQITSPRVQAMEDSVTSGKKILASTSRSHTVQAGDTLSLVAKKAGSSVAELRKLNQMDDTATLKLGQTLALPNEKTVASTAAAKKSTQAKDSTNNTASDKTAHSKTAANKTTASKAAGATSTEPSGKTAYKVQSGDTLMVIARKHKLNVNDIARWNAIDKNSYTLQPGQMLTLYLAQRDKL
jgi:membrane-bound lytic murein transglycosylase D